MFFVKDFAKQYSVSENTVRIVLKNLFNIDAKNSFFLDTHYQEIELRRYLEQI